MRKLWVAPKLVVHGNVDAITQLIDKKFSGPADGLIFSGTALANAS
jgi:hypothetical protein